MSKYLVATKQFDNSDENQNTFIIGKSHFENINQNETFSTIKNFFETKIQLNFDTDGGNVLESKEVVLGKPYGELPIPTKQQNIFLGWFTASSGGTQITSETLVSLDINILYAQWEEIQIDSDCTSYKVTTTDYYNNTGIYQANAYNSNDYTYIDWGDGTVEKINSDISYKTHTYKTTGDFIVKISNNLTSFSISYDDYDWGEYTSNNWYTFKGMLTTGSKITSLPSYAFCNCQAITDIDFMETCFSNVTSLPDYCFYYCTSLTSIQGAKRFTSLGSHCFYGCEGLTGVQDLSEFKFTTLPNSYTFANCQNVTQWILPSEFNGTSFGSYMFANNSKLNSVNNLPYDAEIEYLESTGTQWIDTQVPNGDILINTRIWYDVFRAQYTRFFGAYKDEESNSTRLILQQSNNQLGYATANGRANHSMSVSISQNIWHDVTIDTIKHQVIIDSVYYSGYASGAIYTGSIKLFAVDERGAQPNQVVRMSYFTIYSANNDTICDFIPVRKGNVGYMYDKVSGKLFENKGTGNFILGPDKQETITSKLPESLTSTGNYVFQNCSSLKNIIIPSKVQSIGSYAFYGCTQLNNVKINSNNLTAINQCAFYNCSKLENIGLYLPYDAEIEYLESTGTQFIKTNIVPMIGDSIKQRFSTTRVLSNKWEQLMGSGSSTYQLCFPTGKDGFGEVLYCRVFGGGNGWNAGMLVTSISTGIQNLDVLYLGDNQYKVSIGDVFINQKAISEIDGNEEDKLLHLFYRPKNGGAYIKCYSFLLYNDNGKVLDLIPVRKGNVGYMYDKVSGKLFGNQGTGDFILGPDKN